MINMESASYDGQRPPAEKSTHFVYILRCSDGTTYTGCTNDMDERLKRHNRGSVPATKYKRPVEIITYITFTDKYKAFAFEKYLKSGSGRAFLNKRLI